MRLSSPAGLRGKEAERLPRLQRRLARAQRRSNRRGRLTAAIARSRARERDRRKDWVEKTSTGPARRFDVIRVEDLNVKDMTRSARGTRDAPGRGVRANAGPNRGIQKADFRPARKARPGLLVTQLDGWARRLRAAGSPVSWDDDLPGMRRFYTRDAVGNRLEFLHSLDGAGPGDQ